MGNALLENITKAAANFKALVRSGTSFRLKISGWQIANQNYAVAETAVALTVPFKVLLSCFEPTSLKLTYSAKCSDLDDALKLLNIKIQPLSPGMRSPLPAAPVRSRLPYASGDVEFIAGGSEDGWVLGPITVEIKTFPASIIHKQRWTSRPTRPRAGRERLCNQTFTKPPAAVPRESVTTSDLRNIAWKTSPRCFLRGLFGTTWLVTSWLAELATTALAAAAALAAVTQPCGL
jgi:hypothetical protein